MTAASLTSLRAQIDALDDQIHDLLIARFAVTAQVAATKGAAQDPTLIPRPAREQAILARRRARHRGDLPEASLVRIWKEIMGAACHQQGDFVVGVAADPFSALATAAREHFGTAVPLNFGTREALAMALRERALALLLVGLDAPATPDFHVVDHLWADGVVLGQLLSPHPLDK